MEASILAAPPNPRLQSAGGKAETVDPLTDGYLYNGEIGRSMTSVPADDPPVRPRVIRPTIIDENDGPCEICAAQRPGCCDYCGLDGKLKDGGLMCGVQSDNTKHVGNRGFQSPKPSHFHLLPIEGVNGRRSYWAELCYNCYRAEYKAVYGKDPFE